jgi:branched-subunit amino acid aminotransferase/4-amino-4-deoxychorismate lyase
LPIIDEAFLSSSSRGIVPIVQIDDVRIGDGMPGRLTAQLSMAYDRWVQANLEPICPDLIT